MYHIFVRVRAFMCIFFGYVLFSKLYAYYIMADMYIQKPERQAEGAGLKGYVKGYILIGILPEYDLRSPYLFSK